MSDCEEAIKSTEAELRNVEDLSDSYRRWSYWDNIPYAEAQDRVRSLAPLLLGTMFEILLFGILTGQIYTYHTRFPHDRIFLKIGAWSSFLAAFILTIAISVDLCQTMPYISINAGISLDQAPDPCPEAALAMTVFLGLNTQIFLAWRIFLLCQKHWLLIFTCCLAASASVFLVFATLQPGITNTFHQLEPIAEQIQLANIATPTWMGLTVLCDLTITSSLVILMFRALKEAIFRNTRRTLSKILKFTLETGLLTTAVIAVQVVLMLTLNQGQNKLSGVRWRYALFYSTGVVYACWLLASLNARSGTVDDGSLVVNTISGLRSTRAGEVNSSEAVVNENTEGKTAEH
ncbi:hypothetical protein AB1N83_001021 [Pleurotus pulmonarius]